MSLETPDAEEYVAAVVAGTTVPGNLPVATPVVGYEAMNTLEEDSNTESLELNDLENQAHAQKVLLSSDAMRYFVSKITSKTDRVYTLDKIVDKARVTFPSEEGWVVINRSRMEDLVDTLGQEVSVEDLDKEEVVFDTSVTPMTAGSLAEAIITGNVVAAFEMIAHRPMVALADAASDMDALYRLRKGEQVIVSDMLAKEAPKLSSEQIEAAIEALTSALDGTYTDEASAVKMAIMKAVKAVS